MLRPGPPLQRVVGAAEENDRYASGRRRQVRRARIGTYEQVGAFEQGRGLGDAEPARPVDELFVRSACGRAEGLQARRR